MAVKCPDCGANNLSAQLPCWACGASLPADKTIQPSAESCIKEPESGHLAHENAKISISPQRGEGGRYLVCPECGTKNMRLEFQCTKCDAPLRERNPPENRGEAGGTTREDDASGMQRRIAEIRSQIEDSERLLRALRTDLNILEAETVRATSELDGSGRVSTEDRLHEDINQFNLLSNEIPEKEAYKLHEFLNQAEKSIDSEDKKRADRLLDAYERKVAQYSGIQVPHIGDSSGDRPESDRRRWNEKDSNGKSCAVCGRPMMNDWRRCPYCFASEAGECKRCGKPTRPGWKKCPYCASILQP